MIRQQLVWTITGGIVVCLIGYSIWFFAFSKGISFININFGSKLVVNKRVANQAFSLYQSANTPKRIFVIFSGKQKTTPYCTGLDPDRNPLYCVELKQFSKLGVFTVYTNQKELHTYTQTEKDTLLTRYIFGQLARFLAVSPQIKLAVLKLVLATTQPVIHYEYKN